LFVVDPAKRLGANGAHEIKAHPYFANIDWNKLQNLEVSPPFIPDVRYFVSGFSFSHVFPYIIG
jgi:hypothetical protein